MFVKFHEKKMYFKCVVFFLRQSNFFVVIVAN